MTLLERLRDVMARVGKMCCEGRPPAMSIPARPDRDDDLVICNAMREAAAELSRLYQIVRAADAMRDYAPRPCENDNCADKLCRSIRAYDAKRAQVQLPEAE